MFKTFFNDHPFTKVVEGELSLKQVVNTNKCLIKLEKTGNQLVIHSAIDNLLKGASGQAVQNMNLMFGLDETTGLRLKANAF
jgi:N-acetyl-gamma-glutamyl-phosphate reductase